MSAEMIFATGVLGIAGLHILFRLVNFLSRFSWVSARESQRGKVRDDDWYVFFKKSDLYGVSVHQEVESELVSDDDESSSCEECHPHEVYA